MVDPGGDLDVVLEMVHDEGLTLRKILLTHGHVDHAAATAALKRRERLPIEGPHTDDLFWIQRLPADAAQFGFPPADAFTPDRWLSQGDTVQLGELTLEVRHCPGHTPGHVVFFHRPSKFAIVGDVIFKGSVGRWDFPGGNQKDLFRSIRENLFPLGDDVKFLPGHGRDVDVRRGAADESVRCRSAVPSDLSLGDASASTAHPDSHGRAQKRFRARHKISFGHTRSGVR